MQFLPSAPDPEAIKSVKVRECSKHSYHKCANDVFYNDVNSYRTVTYLLHSWITIGNLLKTDTSGFEILLSLPTPRL